MVATTNTMGLVAVHAYPTSVSVTTNLSPIIPSTIVRVVNQVVVNQAAIIAATYRPTDILNFPRVATVFNRVPNFVPASYVPPPVASVINQFWDVPIIDNRAGPIINSNWQLPHISQQAPNGVPSSYQVIQDFPTIAPIVIRTIFTPPTQGGIDFQPTSNRSISVEQNLWWAWWADHFHPYAIAEILSLVESVLRKVKPKVAGETLSLAESKLLKVIRKVSETIGLAETSPIKRKITRAISETLGLSESILRKVIRKTTDTLSLAESIVFHKIKPRPVSETLTLTETSPIKRKITRAISETLTLPESIKRKVIRPISETLSLLESVLRKSKPKVAGETLTLTETTLRKVIRKITDTLHLTEAISAIRVIKKAISETLHLAESIAYVKIRPPKLISETVGLAETKLRKVIPYIGHQVYHVFEDDTLTLSESVRTKRKRSIVEIISLAESIIRKPRPKVVTETITLVETAIKRGMTRSISETLHLSEIIKQGGKFVFRIFENLTLLETVVRKPKPKILAETISLAEAKLRKVIFNKAETLGLAETTILRKVKIRIKETLSVTEDHIHIIISHGRRLREIIPTAKQIPNIRYIIRIKESLSLKEKVESDESGPSFRWKFVPQWFKDWKKRQNDTSNKS